MYDALALDVNATTFEQLIKWDFVQGLAYATQTPQDGAFIQLIYTTRLRKYKHAEDHALTRQWLVEEYGLAENPDVLFSFADALSLARLFRGKRQATPASAVFNPLQNSRLGLDS
ncbi:hypothetical protein D9757_007956 [Collybiopsis confluens]|uniref:Uncharacterized protein n=1 Tax=Collybiopsis confluens TaxID=2823264 RepID=A0A8H5M4B8_9AGAR|nr:hypothetical protein D9757_007956 [Collybiopsis confluens]